jgi:hypothetical protein
MALALWLCETPLPMEFAGPGAFQNERATQWLAKLEATHDLVIFTQVFKPDPEGAFFDKDTGSEIYAAAEVVAAATGKPAGDLPPRVTEWVSKHQNLDFAPLKEAARALAHALLSPRSELHDLWDEQGEPYESWVARIEDLVARLE